MEEEILIKLQDAFEKKYRIRRTGENGLSFETTIPRIVIEREAKRLGIQLDDAHRELVAVWRFNEFRGLHMELVRRKGGEK